jgi:hypothetical protein
MSRCGVNELRASGMLRVSGMMRGAASLRREKSLRLSNERGSIVRPE